MPEGSVEVDDVSGSFVNVLKGLNFVFPCFLSIFVTICFESKGVGSFGVILSRFSN